MVPKGFLGSMKAPFAALIMLVAPIVLSGCVESPAGAQPMPLVPLEHGRAKATLEPASPAGDDGAPKQEEAAAAAKGAVVTQRYEASWTVGLASELCTTYVGLGVSTTLWGLYLQHGDGITHDRFAVHQATQGMMYRIVSTQWFRLEFFRADGAWLDSHQTGGTSATLSSLTWRVGTVPSGAASAVVYSCVDGPGEATYDVYPAEEVHFEAQDGTLPTHVSDGCPGTLTAFAGLGQPKLEFDVPATLQDGSRTAPQRASFHFDSPVPARARLIVLDQDGLFLAEAYDQVVAMLPPDVTRLTVTVDACPVSAGQFSVVGLMDLGKP
jgi:hypothetical protein